MRIVASEGRCFFFSLFLYAYTLLMFRVIYTCSSLELVVPRKLELIFLFFFLAIWKIEHMLFAPSPQPQTVNTAFTACLTAMLAMLRCLLRKNTLLLLSLLRICGIKVQTKIVFALFCYLSSLQTAQRRVVFAALLLFISLIVLFNTVFRVLLIFDHFFHFWNR
jgi:hypothetical protein